MAQFDLPLAQLLDYRSGVVAPADFDEFWTATLDAARRHDLAAQLRRVDSPLGLVEVYDVRFAGWDGERVAGWLVLPAGRSGPVPAVLSLPGYGNGRGLPHQHLFWPAAGFAVLALDARGQGARGNEGVTGDSEAPVGPQYPGFLTRGITDPASYYYRRLITDCVRAVDLLTGQPELVDPQRVAVAGGSQGGGLSLAVGALHPAIRAVAPAVPFLCDFPRAITVTDEEPYAEIAHYLAARRDQVDTVARTLSYIDGVLFAARASAPALFSVALMDLVCPPSTVYGAYNAYTGRKQIRVYPFNGHEGGGAEHDLDVLGFVRAALDT